MVDIFLMGTIGQSKWREPIKAACESLNVEVFDPVVPEWNEEAKRREIEALQSARVIVMAITAETASVASLGESGWAALSAIQRGQAFGLYVDAAVDDLDNQPSRATLTGPGAWVLDMFFGGRERFQTEDLEEASKRARKLVIGHVLSLTREFPNLRLHIAHNLQDLQDWAIKTAQELSQKPKL